MGEPKLDYRNFFNLYLMPSRRFSLLREEAVPNDLVYYIPLLTFILIITFFICLAFFSMHSMTLSLFTQKNEIPRLIQDFQSKTASRLPVLMDLLRLYVDCMRF